MSPDERPHVSIIIPVFNQGNDLISMPSSAERADISELQVRSRRRRQWLQPSYQLRSKISRETAAGLARFWLADGSRPLTGSIPALNATLAELRAGFLAYVEQRYGLSDRARLEAELDEALSGRIRYWLFRSLRFQHGNACRDLLTIARARREVMSVSATALGLAAGAITRRVRSKPAGR